MFQLCKLVIFIVVFYFQSWDNLVTCVLSYHIAGKFGGYKVWGIYSYKVLERKSLVNG